MNRYRVLIVDDEPVIRMDLRAMLESMGHTVVGEADNGETALQLARTLKPRLGDCGHHDARYERNRAGATAVA
jgi:DNA-binding NarL/FixJ family response regulator